MCYISSASLEPCDCPSPCDTCGDVTNDDRSFYIESRDIVLCDLCYDKGVACDGCDTMLTWDDYEAQVAANGEAWCEECTKENEEE